MRPRKKAIWTALRGFAPIEIRMNQPLNRYTAVIRVAFPQFFPQVWKTLGRDQRVHGITAAGIVFEKDADCSTVRAD